MTTETKTSGFWKTAIIYGGLSGLLVICWMLANFELVGFHSGPAAMAVGFLIMFSILSLLFFGMKKYRDRELGGEMKFSKALLFGVAMAVFAALAYVTISEIYMALTDGQFIEDYTAFLIETKKAGGVSGAELENFIAKQEELKVSYAKPGFRMGMTFFELFPMAFIVALISALILHKPKFWSKG